MRWLALAIAAWSSTAAASPATRDECKQAMTRIKAWEGDPTPPSDAEMAECVKQASGEQARCIIAAATKEAGRACISGGGATATPATPATPTPVAVAADPLEKVAAPCRLSASAPKPLTGPLAHVVRATSDDVRPHQSLIVKVDEAVRVFDPMHLERTVPAPEDLREAMLLPSRLVGVRSRDELVTAPATGAPLTLLRKERTFLIDAVAAGRDTFVAGMGENRLLFVDRIDGAGKLAAHHVVRSESPMAVRIARATGGALALAWLVYDGRRATTLRFAWLDGDGNVKGAPATVDSGVEQQAYANLALAAHRDGVVVAWNPIVGRGEGERIPVELRIFAASAGAAPAPLRRVQILSQSWVVAGSAGGVLPNFVQALPFGREAAIVWWEIDKQRSELRGVVADGGAPVVLARDLRGQPIARSDGKSATVLLEAREGAHQSLTLRCEK